MSRILIVRGLPGAGKSTYIKNNYPGLLTLETDEFNIVDGEYVWTPERAKEAIKLINDIFQMLIKSPNRPDFVLCGVYSKLLSFESYVDAAIKTGKYDVYIKTLTTQYKTIHNVPTETIEIFRKNFASDDEIVKRYKCYGSKIHFEEMPKINL